MIRKIIYTGIAALAFSSCQYNVEEVLLSREDISLTVKGEVQMTFAEKTCQLGYNTARNEFRVYDEKLANWFILRCSAKPTSIGQKLKADLEYTSVNDVKTMTGLEFTVEDTNSEGFVWLWNKDKQIGIVVKNL